MRPFIPMEPKRDIREGAFASVYEFMANPNWIVKELSQVYDDSYQSWLVCHDLDPNIPLPDMTIERFRQEVVHDKQIIDNNQSNFKRFLPPFYLVYGQDSHNSEKGYIVMKRIHGQELISFNEINEVQVKQLEELLLSAFDFYEESKAQEPESDKTHGYFPDVIETIADRPGDAVLNNIMFGNLDDDPDQQTNQIYMIDSYPLRIIWSDQSIFFNKLTAAISNFEDRYGVKFSQELHYRLNKYGLKNNL